MLYLTTLIHFFHVDLEVHSLKRHSLFPSHYLPPRPPLRYPWPQDIQDNSRNRNDLFSGRKGNMSVYISCTGNYTIGLRADFLLAYYYFIIILKIIIWSHKTWAVIWNYGYNRGKEDASSLAEVWTVSYRLVTFPKILCFLLWFVCSFLLLLFCFQLWLNFGYRQCFKYMDISQRSCRISLWGGLFKVILRITRRIVGRNSYVKEERGLEDSRNIG